MPPPDSKAAVAKSVANQTRGQQINLNNASNTATIAKKTLFFQLQYKLHAHGIKAAVVQSQTHLKHTQHCLTKGVVTHVHTEALLLASGSPV